MTSPHSRRNGPPGDTPPATRRRFLRATGTAAIAGLAAGCQTGLPPLGGGIRFGRVEVPDPDPPVYRRWLPDPTVMRDLTGDQDGYGIHHSSPARWLRERPAPVGLLGLTLSTHDADWFGYDLAEIERVLGVGPVLVVLGDLNRSTVVDALLAGGYERMEDYGEFTLYARPDGRYAAVDEGRVLWSNDVESDHDLRRVVDARTGTVDRYHEADADVATLTEHVGASVDTLTGFATPDPTDEAVDGALSVRLGPDALFYVQDVLFPPDTDVPVAAIEDHLDRQGRPGDADAVDVEAVGQFASVEMRMSNERVRSDAPDVDRPPVPLVTWEHERDGDEVTIRHLAGESVPADAVTVHLDGGDATETQWSDADDTIESGASLTVSVDDLGADRGLHVVYEPNEDSSVAVYDAEVE